MLEPTLLPALERALQDLQFGYVQLVIHEGRLVRIERVERVRLTGPSGSQTAPISQPTSPQEEGLDERT